MLTLALNDFRTTYREPMFRLILAFPLLNFAIVRWVLPVVTAAYPVVVPYVPVIIMWACLQTGTMFGFLYGFLLLEERETHVDQALRLLPVSGARLLRSRLLIGFAIGWLVNWLILAYGGAVALAGFQSVLLAAQYSLLAPLFTLLLGTLADNRIQGLAQLKLFNMAVIVPALIYFLPGRWLHTLAVVPSYWWFRATEAAVARDTQSFWLFGGVGLVYFALLLLILGKAFRQKF